MKPILLIAFLFISVCLMAQKKESFYVYDSSWHPTNLDSARFMLRILQKNDTAWQYDFYSFKGPLLKSEQYNRKEGGILNGPVRYYDAAGNMDSTGTYYKSKLHGDFYKLQMINDTMRYIRKYIYSNDSLINIVELDKPGETKKSFADEQESEYPGGSKRWIKYLMKNLNYPPRAYAGNIEGNVRVAFMVDSVGQVHDPFIARSVEYSLDDESIRIILGSGKWNPAFQDGRNVKSYKIQPISYRLK